MHSAFKLNKQSDNIQALTYSFRDLEPVSSSDSTNVLHPSKQYGTDAEIEIHINVTGQRIQK